MEATDVGLPLLLFADIACAPSLATFADAVLIIAAEAAVLLVEEVVADPALLEAHFVVLNVALVVALVEVATLLELEAAVLFVPEAVLLFNAGFVVLDVALVVEFVAEDTFTCLPKFTLFLCTKLIFLDSFSILKILKNVKSNNFKGTSSLEQLCILIVDNFNVDSL